MTKISCLGAGSASFGLSTLITLLQSDALRGAEIALVDTNQESLDLISELANWLNKDLNAGKRISSHSRHASALKGSEFVISAIEVQPREKLWQQDFELSQKYGLRQPYAENGGPGGFAHAARNVNTILEIVKEMETACPEALFINFSNPMHRICYLINEYSKIKVVGLCHQIASAYAMIAKALAPIFGFEGADAFLSTHADPANDQPQRQMALQGFDKFAIKAAGLNHFTWLIALNDRRTGDDLYPLLREYWEKLPEDFEPLTRKVFKYFNLFPIPGDEHLCEYLPWMSSPLTKPWQKYELSLYDWAYFHSNRERQWQQLAAEVREKENIRPYLEPQSEGAVEIIEAVFLNRPLNWEAINLPNGQAISGLAPNAIVEVPALVSGSGFETESGIELPKGIVSLLQREVASSQLCIDAVVNGDRQTAIQSLLLDPVVDDLDLAEEILDEILLSYKSFLPQFFN